MSRTAHLRRVLVCFAASLVVASPAAADPAPVVTHVSTSPLGSPSGDGLLYAQIAHDGERIAFVTQDQLLAADAEQWSRDLYERRASGELRLVTAQPSQAPAPEYSNRYDDFVLSRDGSRILFRTNERLAASDGDDADDLYSISSSGTEHLTASLSGPPGTLYWWVVSGDGRSIFVYSAEEFVPGGGAAYLRTPAHGWVALRPEPGAGMLPMGVDAPRISRGGERVSFESGGRFVAADNDGTSIDAHVMSATGAVTKLTPSTTGFPLDNATESIGGMTPSGDTVFFTTDSAHSPLDQNDSRDVYSWRPPNELTLLSTAPGVAHTAADYVHFCGASDDGKIVALQASETPLLPEDTDGQPDVYVRRADGSLFLADASFNGSTGCLSGPNVSADGSRVVLRTDQPLLPSDTDAAIDLYVRTIDGPLVHVTDGLWDGEVAAEFSAMSDDGRVVVFRTEESLTFGDTDSVADLYRWDPVGGLTMVSRSPRDGTPEPVYFSGMSGDGSRVLFVGKERLAPTDEDFFLDAYVFGPPETPPAVDGPPVAPPATPSPSPTPAGTDARPPTPRAAAVDRTAPSIARLRVARRVVVRDGLLPMLLPSASGAHLAFRLSEKSDVAIHLERESAGRRSRGRCVAPQAAPRRAVACVRRTRIRSPIPLPALSGGDHWLRFGYGLTPNRKLGPGSYRLVLAAEDAARNRARRTSARFTVRIVR